MKTYNEIYDEVKKFTANQFDEGSWQCFGAGEIGCEVFFVNPLTGEKEFAYDLAGDNGTNTFYNPSGEAWTEDRNEEKEKEIAEDFCAGLSADQILKIYTNSVMFRVNGCSQYI